MLGRVNIVAHGVTVNSRMNWSMNIYALNSSCKVVYKFEYQVSKETLLETCVNNVSTRIYLLGYTYTLSRRKGENIPRDIFGESGLVVEAL